MGRQTDSKKTHSVFRKVEKTITSIFIITGILAICASVASANPIFVSPTGDDGADGLTQENAIQTVTEVIDRLESGLTVIFLPGEYPVAQDTTVKRSHVTFTALDPGTAILNMVGFFKVIAQNVTFSDLVLNGNFVGGRAIQGVGYGASDYLTIDNCEVKNFTRHAIDVDGDYSQVKNSHIHHILWYENGQRYDAHGIVTKSGQHITIENCEIHHVSGDSFQADRGSWEDILIKDCHFWDGPLSEDMAGFLAGEIAGENAVDTKRGWRERSKVTVLRSNFHGFRSSYISNAAVLNLKEAVEVVVDSCSIWDSHIAFRLRGDSSYSYLKMQPTIINSVIFDNDIMMRHEDNLYFCKFLHNTIHNNTTLYVRAPNSTDWGENWATVNNLFIETDVLAEEASNPDKGGVNNLTPGLDEVDANLVPYVGSNAVEITGQVPDWYEATGRVVLDKNGMDRYPVSAVGAYEVLTWCLYDLDNDNDIDGLDLYLLLPDPDDSIIAAFALEFGTGNCGSD